jgi:hypothetical protein
MSVTTRLVPDQQLSAGTETHDAPDRFISITRARCIARYRMHTIPGRPEELETNQYCFPIGKMTTEETVVTKRVISFGYAGGEVRIRKHGGPTNREWVETCDIRLADGWLDKVYEFLDEFLAYVSPSSVRPRPIHDNPQA